MWRPTDEYLKPFRREVEYFRDCREPGKPIYHSLLHLAKKLPGFTGLINSTPVESWTEEKRLRRWAVLKAAAGRSLDEAVSGPGRKNKRRAGVTTKKPTRTVTTKTYTRFNPNPKKYSDNAARQRAYRARRARG